MPTMQEKRDRIERRTKRIYELHQKGNNQPQIASMLGIGVYVISKTLAELGHGHFKRDKEGRLERKERAEIAFKLYKQGMTQRDIAKKFKTSATTICKAISSMR